MCVCTHIENEGLTLSKQPTDGQETLASDGLATSKDMPYSGYVWQD